MKHIVFVMSFVLVFAFTQNDNSKEAQVDKAAVQETVAVDEDSSKHHQICKHKCDRDKEDFKKSESCKHKCDKNKEECKTSKSCKHKCNKNKEETKENTDN